jgi:hypothetical protein
VHVTNYGAVRGVGLQGRTLQRSLVKNALSSSSLPTSRTLHTSAALFCCSTGDTALDLCVVFTGKQVPSSVVFWVVTSCGLVRGYERFRGNYRLRLQPIFTAMRTPNLTWVSYSACTTVTYGRLLVEPSVRNGSAHSSAPAMG